MNNHTHTQTLYIYSYVNMHYSVPIDTRSFIYKHSNTKIHT